MRPYICGSIRLFPRFAPTSLHASAFVYYMSCHIFPFRFRVRVITMER